MNDLIIKEEIENMIYEIRGKQVMLDSDLAYLFGYMTKDLNRNVKNNIDRFPNNYCFQLTEDEYNSLKCKNFTLKSSRGKHRKYLPYVFTEYGVTMLAGILKSDVAVKASLKIVNTFIKLRKYVNTNKDTLLNIETKLIDHDNQLLNQNDKINMLFDKLETKEKINQIFFEGQIYDAYSLLIDILKNAKEEIIIIDNYASKELFDILKDIKINIKIVTKNINDILIKKYNKQYNNIEIIYNDSFHDRFIIIDRKILYHSGASFKDLGHKYFGINKIEDKKYLKQLLESVDDYE